MFVSVVEEFQNPVGRKLERLLGTSLKEFELVEKFSSSKQSETISHSTKQ